MTIKKNNKKLCENCAKQSDCEEFSKENLHIISCRNKIVCEEIDLESHRKILEHIKNHSDKKVSIKSIAYLVCVCAKSLISESKYDGLTIQNVCETILSNLGFNKLTSIEALLEGKDND